MIASWPSFTKTCFGFGQLADLLRQRGPLRLQGFQRIHHVGFGAGIARHQFQLHIDALLKRVARLSQNPEHFSFSAQFKRQRFERLPRRK